MFGEERLSVAPLSVTSEVISSQSLVASGCGRRLGGSSACASPGGFHRSLTRSPRHHYGLALWRWDDAVDHSQLERLLSSEEVVLKQGSFHFFEGDVTVRCHDANHLQVELVTEFHVRFHMAVSALISPARLVNHDGGIRVGKSPARCPGAEQESAHAGTHAHADRANRALDVLHGVVEGKTSRDNATRAVDVHLDLRVIRVGYIGVKVEQLGLSRCARSLIKLTGKKNDAVGEELANGIGSHYAALHLLADRRHEGGDGATSILGQDQILRRGFKFPCVGHDWKSPRNMV